MPRKPPSAAGIGLVQACVGVATLALFASTAVAAPKKTTGSEADRGLALAKSGDCVAAVPVLEKAELDGHRPSTASALAGCHVALGDLILALEIYSALADEPKDASWSKSDRKAQGDARDAADELDARIPRLELSVTPNDADYSVKIGTRDLGKKRGPLPVPPDEKVDVVISADGFEAHTESIVLGEGAKKQLAVRLDRSGGTAPPKPVPPPTKALGSRYWLGARFRGYLVPNFVMNIVVDGGTTTFVPAGEVTFTARLADVDLVAAIGATSLGLGATAVKPPGTPNTEWEIVESDLVGITATLDILYRFRLDEAGVATLGLGGGVGIGFAPIGDLYRWQAYPTGDPDDPSTYAKCKAPNDPAGSYRYCNQLDKDAHRYGEGDAAWGNGGARPVIYPWVALPLVALAFRPDDHVEIGVDLGVTLQGFLMGTGVRFGLD